LAAFVDQHLPITEPIDLLNVAFENPRVQKAKAPAKTEKKNKKKNKGTQYPLQEEEIKKETKEAESKRSMYDTPDRLTGRQGVEELRFGQKSQCIKAVFGSYMTSLGVYRLKELGTLWKSMCLIQKHLSRDNISLIRCIHWILSWTWLE
jgi:hypothetical protein